MQKMWFSDIRALTLDHINDNGAKERQKIFGKRDRCGTIFYIWIRRQGYPEGYQVLCMNDQWLKREPEDAQDITIA